MTMAGERVFVDTNVLVYATRPSSGMQRQASKALQDLEDGGAELCISRQIIREYLATVTRPQAASVPLAPAVAVGDAKRFAEIYTILEDGPAITDALLDVVARFATGGRQIHDANIVATMLAHGVRRLLTFNTADFARFGGMIDLESLPAA